MGQRIARKWERVWSIALVFAGGCGDTAALAEKQRTIDRLTEQLRENGCDAVPPQQTSETIASSDRPDRSTDPTTSEHDTPQRAVMLPDLEHRFGVSSIVGYGLSRANINRGELGVGFQYYLTEKMGIAVSARELGVAASTTTSPARDTSWMTDIESLYMPFGLPMLHVLGGVGTVMTRPVAVVDPMRHFDATPRVAFVVGLGSEVPLSHWLSLNCEFRDVMYTTDVENPQIATMPAMPSTWLATTTQLVNDVELEFGLTILFPM